MSEMPNTSLVKPLFDVPFEWVLPDQQTVPVIFNSPHSGNVYPSTFLDASILSARRLRKSEDSLVADLIEPFVKLGAPLLKAHFPRAYLDVNREPYELDPAMFEDKLPDFANTSSARALAGLGTVPRIVSEYENIYAHKLAWSEANDRIETLYFPYHAALREKLQHTSDRFGQAILLDCHSMPSSAVTGIRKNSGSIDVILGDRYGGSCDEATIALLEALFVKTGLNVIRNRPYAGGFITQNYGQATSAIQSIQIELNRGLYMNERTFEPNAGFAMLSKALERVFETFLPAVADLSPDLQIAAE